jgi:hypothetical protein
MIDTTFSTRMDLLALRSEKNAYAMSLEALKTLPVTAATGLIQGWLDGCEDREISAERKLEGLSAKCNSIGKNV